MIDKKRANGQYYTVHNPFAHKAFKEWRQQFADDAVILEPFAGANSLIKMLTALGACAHYQSYDILPTCDDVEQRDTIVDFPTGYIAIVTNPPYLAKNSATRRGISATFGKYDDLYKHCLDLCLANADYIAAIVPESLIASGLFRDRMQAVISLNIKMFDDTSCPVCLALFGRTTTSRTDMWIGDRYVDYIESIEQYASTLGLASANVTFNDPEGGIGLYAIDNCHEGSIAFCDGSEIPSSVIKHSSRTVTRISISPHLNGRKLRKVIEVANRRLAEYRESTSDVLMTAFKGLRKDGVYRRRLDYTTARMLLLASLEEVNNDGES